MGACAHKRKPKEGFGLMLSICLFWIPSQPNLSFLESDGVGSTFPSIILLLNSNSHLF